MNSNTANNVNDDIAKLDFSKMIQCEEHKFTEHKLAEVKGLIWLMFNIQEDDSPNDAAELISFVKDKLIDLRTLCENIIDMEDDLADSEDEEEDEWADSEDEEEDEWADTEDEDEEEEEWEDSEDEEEDDWKLDPDYYPSKDTMQEAIDKINEYLDEYFSKCTVLDGDSNSLLRILVLNGFELLNTVRTVKYAEVVETYLTAVLMFKDMRSEYNHISELEYDEDDEEEMRGTLLDEGFVSLESGIEDAREGETQKGVMIELQEAMDIIHTVYPNLLSSRREKLLALADRYTEESHSDEEESKIVQGVETFKEKVNEIEKLSTIDELMETAEDEECFIQYIEDLR